MSDVSNATNYTFLFPVDDILITWHFILGETIS